MTIIPQDEPQADVAAVLRAAADRLHQLPHARIVPTDVQRAVRLAAGTYRDAQAALDVFAGHLRTACGEQWFATWSVPRARADVEAELRAAAGVVEQAEAAPSMTAVVDVLLKAADHIEAYELTVFNVVHVLRAAAAEMVVFGPAAIQLADAAALLLARRLRYSVVRSPVNDLRRWSSTHTPDQIVAELRAAATLPPAFVDLRPGVLARIPRVHARPGEQQPVIRVETAQEPCSNDDCCDVQMWVRDIESGAVYVAHRPPTFEVEIVSPTIKELSA
jgi:hypothetical protein